MQVHMVVKHHKGEERLFDSFVHDLYLLRYKGDLFIAKEESVYENINHCSYDFRSFFHFVHSVFNVGDYSTPYWTYYGTDEDGQKQEIQFVYWQLLEKQHVLKQLSDDIEDKEIDDPVILNLFQIYLQKKRSLIQVDGEIYTDIYNQHGRDVVNEVLASAVGQMLDIKVPINFFGMQNVEFQQPFSRLEQGDVIQGVRRFSLTKSICNDFPCLSFFQDLYMEIYKDKALEELRLDLTKVWHRGNPFHFFLDGENKDAKISQFRQTLQPWIRSHYPNYLDFIDSDILDRFLGAYDDRKIQEFLLYQGSDGNIFTVDYGEILFPQLGLDSQDIRFITKQHEFVQKFLAYCEEVLNSEDLMYRKHLLLFLEKLNHLPEDFFEGLISRMPKFFFQYHWDNHKLSYRPDTIVSFFQYYMSEIRNHLGTYV